jgi:hypothetical protein
MGEGHAGSKHPFSLGVSQIGSSDAGVHGSSSVRGGAHHDDPQLATAEAVANEGSNKRTAPIASDDVGAARVPENSDPNTISGHLGSASAVEA